ncbi:MAG: NADH-quinone oxidoreductase subunit NuoG [Nitrospirae bacterium]|nr:NADH-quinone oxidoreductase subunit NuoG [Nitrospirota bacterium]
MVNITINGKKLSVQEGTTILEAALQNKIDIPHLCYDKRLVPYGACRLCVVEVEGQMKLLAACSTPVTPNMSVKTETPKLLKARRTVLELLLIHHPLDCPVCDKAGECKLQDLAFKYGAADSRFKAKKKHDTADTGSPFVERNSNRCVLCGKCVRVCGELQGVGAINIIGRGFESKISPAFEERLDCEFCGQCIDACPVGALGRRSYRHSARAWFLESHDNICPYCGVGCTVTYDLKEGKIMRARGIEDKGINKGNLCSRGRFGYDFIYSEKRLAVPLIKEGSGFKKASWDEALKFIAERIQVIKHAHGADSIGAIGSPRCTVEDNYMLQKFMKSVNSSNNIDSSARFGYAKILDAVDMAFGLKSLPVDHDSPLGKEVILVIESDITSTHPVWGLNFLKAEREGTNLIVAETRETKLTRHSSRWLRIKPGTGVALLNCIIKVALDEGLYDKERVSKVEGFSFLTETVNDYSPAAVSRITGISEDILIKTAREFLSAKSRLISLTLGASENTKGIDTALAAANLIILTGEKPSSLQMPAEYCNTFGMWEAGVRPEIPGKDATSMLYKEGAVKALFIMGENPVVTFPDSSTVEKTLTGLDFLVVQDITLTDTAKLADVVLPSSGWAEKDGTFINAGGIAQNVKRIVKPFGKSVADWQILKNLSKAMGAEIGIKDITVLQEEIKNRKPEAGRLKLTFNPVTYTPVGEYDTEFPLRMITGNLMQHSGALSAMSKNQGNAIASAFIQVCRADAERYNIRDNGFVNLSSKNGSVLVKAQISEEVPEGTVFAPVHFHHARINNLTSLSPDGSSPICAVKIKAVN